MAEKAVGLREIKGTLDRITTASIPDAVDLLAEVVSQDGKVLGAAKVDDSGGFRLLIENTKDVPRELFLQIRPDVDEPLPEVLRIPIKTEAGKEGLLELKSPIILPKELRLKWGPLLEICCSRGRVVACRNRWPWLFPFKPLCCAVPGAKVEAYVWEMTAFGIRRKVLGTAITDSNGYFRICTIRVRIPPVIVPRWPEIDWDDLIKPFDPIIPEINPPIPLPDPPPWEGILEAWGQERQIFKDVPQIPNVMPRALDEFTPTAVQALTTKMRPEAFSNMPAAHKAIMPQVKPLMPPHIVTSPCTAGWHYRVTQTVDGVSKLVYDDGLFPLPHTLWPFGYITLYANSAAMCGTQGPPDVELGGKCFRFTGVGNIGIDHIAGWADTTPLFAGPGPAPFNVPRVRDAAFAGRLSVYGKFAATWTHYRVEYQQLGGTLRVPAAAVASGWRPFTEAFAFATQYINLDAGDPANFGHIQTKTVVSQPVKVGTQWVYAIPDAVVAANRPSPAWQPLSSMQPVTLGVNTGQLIPAGAGRFVFRVIPVVVSGGAITQECAAANLDNPLDLVVDNTPVNFGITRLENQAGASLLGSECPKATLTADNHKLLAEFRAVDANGHLDYLHVRMRVGNAGTKEIVSPMNYEAPAGASLVGTWYGLPAGSAAPAPLVNQPPQIELFTSIVAESWADKSFYGGTGTLQAFKTWWINEVPDVATGGCPFAIDVTARKRTTDGFGAPGNVTETKLFMVRV